MSNHNIQNPPQKFNFTPRPENAPAAMPGLNYALVLWRRKFLILLSAVVGLCAAFVWVVWQPPLYKSSVTIELVGFNESFMGMNVFDPQAGTGLYSNIQTQLRVLSSGNLSKRVVERINLELTPVSTPADDLFGKIRNKLGLEGTEPVEHLQRAIQEAATSMKPRAVGTSRLIEITCESTSPEVAAAFANAVASEYISQNLQFRSNSSVRTTQWLEGQAEELKNRLEQATKKLQDFTRQKGSAFVLDENTLQSSKLKQLQGELSLQQSDRIAKQLKFETAKTSPIDVLPDVLDDATLKAARFKVVELKREMSTLRSTLTGEHPKVKRLQAQILELEETMEREKLIWVTRIKNDYETSLKKERMLSSAYYGQAQSVAGESGQASEFETMKREVEMARQNYNQMLQQYNQSSMVSAVPTNNVRIIDSASPSKLPFAPKPTADMAKGVALGLFLPSGIIVLFELLKAKRLSKMVGSPGTTSRFLELPELAVIPAFEKPASKPRFRRKQPVVLLEEIVPEIPVKRELAAWNGKASMVAESFRFALTSLLRLQSRHPKPVFLVTSPGAGEGKTTVTANLAMALAESGKKVLIIDTDLRRPRLQELFQLPVKAGLNEILTGEAAVSDLNLEDYIQPTNVSGLHVLPAGAEEVENPGQLFFSSRLPALIDRVRQDYDAVLLDTAPVLYFSDARLLGRVSDGVVLVLRSKSTQNENALDARQIFVEDGIPLLGTILNDWQPEAHEMQQRAGYYGYRYANKE